MQGQQMQGQPMQGQQMQGQPMQGQQMRVMPAPMHGGQPMQGQQMQGQQIVYMPAPQNTFVHTPHAPQPPKTMPSASSSQGTIQTQAQLVSAVGQAIAHAAEASSRAQRL